MQRRARRRAAHTSHAAFAAPSLTLTAPTVKPATTGNDYRAPLPATLSHLGGMTMSLCLDSGSQACVTTDMPHTVGAVNRVAAGDFLPNARKSWIALSPTASSLCAFPLHTNKLICAPIAAPPPPGRITYRATAETEGRPVLLFADIHMAHDRIHFTRKIEHFQRALSRTTVELERALAAPELAPRTMGAPGKASGPIAHSTSGGEPICWGPAEDRTCMDGDGGEDHFGRDGEWNNYGGWAEPITSVEVIGIREAPPPAASTPAPAPAPITKAKNGCTVTEGVTICTIRGIRLPVPRPLPLPPVSGLDPEPAPWRPGQVTKPWSLCEILGCGEPMPSKRIPESKKKQCDAALAAGEEMCEDMAVRTGSGVDYRGCLDRIRNDYANCLVGRKTLAPERR